jgi:hypothetical protein
MPDKKVSCREPLGDVGRVVLKEQGHAVHRVRAEALSTAGADHGDLGNRAAALIVMLISAAGSR